MSDEASVLAAAEFYARKTAMRGKDRAVIADEIRWAIAEAAVGALEAYGNNDQEPPCARGVDCDWCECPFHIALAEWRAKLPARNAEEV